MKSRDRIGLLVLVVALLCAMSTAAYAETIYYKDLQRSPMGYEGWEIKFPATVVQQLDVPNSADIYLLVNFGKKSGDIVYCYLENFKNWTWDGKFKDTGLQRLIEGDVVDITATMLGEITYTTVQNVDKTVPYMQVTYIYVYD